MWAQGFDTLCTSHFEDIHLSGTPLNLSSNGAAHITLPFDFQLDGITSRDLVISNNGGVLFNATDDSKPVYCTGSETFFDDFPMGFYPLWANVEDDTGNVYWEIKGTAPNRYLVVEWYERPVTQYYSKATFELILHESTNEVEFHYGNMEFYYGDNDIYYFIFRGIKGNHVLYKLDQYLFFAAPPEENTCLHWSAPDRYTPVFYTETIDSCETGHGWLKIYVTDLGGAEEAVFESGNLMLLDTVRTVPDTLLWGPFNTTPSSTDFFSGFKSIWVNVPDSSFLEGYRLVPFHCPLSNDSWRGALDFPYNDTTSCVQFFDTHNALATGPGKVDSLPGTPDDDVWFVFEAISDTVLININYVNAPLWQTDLVESSRMAMALYKYEDDTIHLVKASPWHQLYADNLEVGQRYYLQVYSYHDLGYKDDVEFSLCAIKAQPPANDDCAHIEEWDEGSNYWRGMLFGAHHDFDVGCLAGKNYPDIIFKARLEPHQYISVEDDTEDFSALNTKLVYIAYGGECPGETMALCDTLRPEWDLEGNYHELVHWVNTTGQPQTVYVIVADTIAQGSLLNLRAYVGCSRYIYLHSFDKDELDRGNIVVEWDYETVDVGTLIQWKEAHETQWHLDSVPPGTLQYVISDVPGGAYQVSVAPHCEDPQFLEPQIACVAYRGGMQEDFENYITWPTCWQYGSGDTVTYWRSGLGNWKWTDFAPDSSMGKGISLQWIDDSYYNYNAQWITTPKTFLTGSNTQLNFDMAITQGASADFTALPPGDTLMVKITTDDGQTWTELARWDQEHSPENLSHFSYDLSEYAGEGVRIAWVAKYGDRSDDRMDARPATEYVTTYLDNIQIGEALIVDRDAALRARLYPNPVRDKLHWQVDGQVINVQLWHLSGQLLGQWPAGMRAYVDVSFLPAGVYLLRLQTADGKIWIKHFIKE